MVLETVGMIKKTIFILKDEESFVKDFDFKQQQLILTKVVSEAYCFNLNEATEVVRCLGWLASERLVIKPFKGKFAPGQIILTRSM